MKRYLLFWSVAALLLGSSCSETGFDEPGTTPDTKFVRMYLSDETTEAEAQSGTQSRAAFSDGYRIAWEAGDQVAINRGDAYPVQQDESGRWYVELAQAESYTVYYPAALCGYDDKGLFGSRIPTPQTYRSGSFDPTALCARAVASKGQKLTFKYLCSVIKVTLRGTAAEQVRKINIATTDLGGERFCAAGLILTEADGTAYLSPMTGDATTYTRSYVDLNVDNVALTAGGVDFYLTIFPTTFTRGFKLTVTLADGRTMVKTGAVGQRAARGRILAMPALQFVAQ